MGLFLNNHPLTELSNSLQKCNIKDSIYIKDGLDEGSHSIKLAGIIIKKDSRMSKRGRFITLIMSDQHGIFEVTIFNEDIFKDYAHLLNVKDAVVVSCEVYKDKGGLRITAGRFASIEDELQGLVHNLKLHPQNQTEVEDIIKLLDSKKTTTNNNSAITIFLPIEKTFIAKITMPHCFRLDEKDVATLTRRNS